MAPNQKAEEKMKEEEIGRRQQIEREKVWRQLLEQRMVWHAIFD